MDPPYLPLDYVLTELPRGAIIARRRYSAEDMHQAPIEIDPITGAEINPDEALEIALVPTSYPTERIDKAKHKIILKYTSDAIKRVPFVGINPRFECNYLRRGVLMVHCHDEPSRNWLERLINGKELWPGVRLHVVEQSKLDKRRRIAVCLKVSPEEPLTAVFHNLRMENSGLNTRRWKLLSDTPKEDGRHFVFGVDEKSVRQIVALRSKINAYGSAVSVRVLGKPV